MIRAKETHCQVPGQRRTDSHGETLRLYDSRTSMSDRGNSSCGIDDRGKTLKCGDRMNAGRLGHSAKYRASSTSVVSGMATVEQVSTGSVLRGITEIERGRRGGNGQEQEPVARKIQIKRDVLFSAEPQRITLFCHTLFSHNFIVLNIPYDCNPLEAIVSHLIATRECKHGPDLVRFTSTVP